MSSRSLLVRNTSPVARLSLSRAGSILGRRSPVISTLPTLYCAPSSILIVTVTRRRCASRRLVDLHVDVPVVVVEGGDPFDVRLQRLIVESASGR